MTNNNRNTDGNDNSNHNRRNQKKKKGQGNGTTTKSEALQGKCDDLKENVFDCNGPKQADQYVTTKREI